MRRKRERKKNRRAQNLNNKRETKKALNNQIGKLDLVAFTRSALIVNVCRFFHFYFIRFLHLIAWPLCYVALFRE